MKDRLLLSVESGKKEIYLSGICITCCNLVALAYLLRFVGSSAL